MVVSVLENAHADSTALYMGRSNRPIPRTCDRSSAGCVACGYHSRSGKTELCWAFTRLNARLGVRQPEASN